MIRIVAGDKGEGKTKCLIQMANEAVENSKGHIVYVDDSKRHIYDLNHNIRFIEAKEFPIEDYKEFFGFICGIISEDHDIDKIFVDGLLKIAHLGIEEIMTFIEKLKSISDRYNIQFVISVSCNNSNIPLSLKPFLVA